MTTDDPNSEFLSEANWQKLIRSIQCRQAVPVIGPGLMVMDEIGGEKNVNLYQWLAPRLADELGLPAEKGPFTQLNQVACEHLVRNGAAEEIHDCLRMIIDDLGNPDCQPLKDLSSITDFDLYVTSTFDPFLAKTLETCRQDFTIHTHEDGGDDANLFHFHPGSPQDLPPRINKPSVYHLLGYVNTYPEFAVWEEDYMEFIYGLIGHRDDLKNLLGYLNHRYLLLLGAPFSDWVVRFLLRIAKDKPLSSRQSQMNYLADDPSNLEEKMVFFFDRVVGTTHIIQGNPAGFVAELVKRWRDKKGITDSGRTDQWASMPNKIPKGAVFVSYASEDAAAAQDLVESLQEAGVPVWFDKSRLRVGTNFDLELEQAVKGQCSFFISLISGTTEADTERTRYFHKEREWAVQRYVPGYEFYLPVIIDDSIDNKDVHCEPEAFSSIHMQRVIRKEDADQFGELMSGLLRRYQEADRVLV